MWNDFLPLKKQGAIPERSQANCRSIISENEFYINYDVLPSEKKMGVPKEIQIEL